MAERVPPALLRVLAWAHARSRVGIAVVGSLPGDDAAAFADHRVLPIGFATDAPSPKQADVLVVAGRVSQKLAPFLVRAHAALAQPSEVLVLELDAEGVGGLPLAYASLVHVSEVLPVDVVVKGRSPSARLIDRALEALDLRHRARIGLGAPGSAAPPQRGSEGPR